MLSPQPYSYLQPLPTDSQLSAFFLTLSNNLRQLYKLLLKSLCLSYNVTAGETINVLLYTLLNLPECHFQGFVVPTLT